MSFAGNKIPAKTQNVIDGKFIDSATTQYVDVHNPATNEVVTQVPCSTLDEMNAAVDVASKAFKTWSKTTPLFRQGIMFKYQELIKKHMRDIAGLITIEQGKTLPDAEGDVLRGLQVVEHCCSITNLLLVKLYFLCSSVALSSLMYFRPICLHTNDHLSLLFY